VDFKIFLLLCDDVVVVDDDGNGDEGDDNDDEEDFCLSGLNQVLPGVAQLVEEVQVEGTFPDGTKLVSIFTRDRPVVKKSE